MNHLSQAGGGHIAHLLGLFAVIDISRR